MSDPRKANPALKKVAIIVDNYKLARFEARITKLGYEYEAKIFSKFITHISIYTEQENVKKIQEMCKTLEFEIKRGN